MTEIPPRRPAKAAPRSPSKAAAIPVLPMPDPQAPDPQAPDLPTPDPEAPHQAPPDPPTPDPPTPDPEAPDPQVPAPAPGKRIRKPLTEEQREKRSAGRRRRWAETRDQRQPLSRYTIRQRNLIEAYLRLGAIAPAAREAGYTRSSAGNWAWQFLRRPDVAAIIEARQAEMRRRSEVTMERVIGELAKLAFADPRDLFTADGRLKPLHQLDDASAASISALEVLAVAGGRRASPTRRKDAGQIGARMKTAAADAAIAGAGAAGAGPGGAGPGLAGTGRAGLVPADGAAAGDGDAADGRVESDGDVVLELRKIKRWDKTKALELLGRYLGLFKDRLELGVSEDLAASIEAARKRSRALAAPQAAKVIEATVAEGRPVEGRVVDAETPGGQDGRCGIGDDRCEGGRQRRLNFPVMPGLDLSARADMRR